MTNLSKLSARKQRLLACACARRGWHLLPSGTLQNAINVSEAFADGDASVEELRIARSAALQIARECAHDGSSESIAARVAAQTAIDVQPFPYEETISISHGVRDALAPRNYRDSSVGETERQVESIFHQRYLEDVEVPAGMVFSPSWRTDTAIALARHIYDSRDFGAMPILADALQDAGCEEPAILEHCRDPKQVHVRGCWVVDLVLGKQ